MTDRPARDKTEGGATPPALKRALFAGALLLVILAAFVAALEASSYLALNHYFAEDGTWLSRREILSTLAVPEKSEGQDSEDSEHDDILQEPDVIKLSILHPYLGFVSDKNSLPGINSYGFYGPEPLMRRARDKVIVAVFGGSVAQEIRNYKDVLSRELKKSPYFFDRKIEVILMGLGGYKQPQQLIALNYLLALGGEFDIVVNLDGFNEVVLPYADNLPYGIAPYFPRQWNLLARKAFDTDTMFLIGKAAVIGEEIERWRHLFAKRPLRDSMTCVLLWNTIKNRKMSEVVSIKRRIAETISKEGLPLQVTGPFVPYEDDPAFFADTVRIWKESSLQMSRLCRANGIAYFHFLQPNQYYEGSKRLTEEEKKKAFDSNHPYRKAVEAGYPLLVEAGKELKAEGVDFTDLTMLFKDVDETLYSDACCHFNQHGYDLLAKEIARVITSD